MSFTESVAVDCLAPILIDTSNSIVLALQSALDKKMNRDAKKRYLF